MLAHESWKHMWDDPYVYRVCIDGLLWRCVPAPEWLQIIDKCHAGSYGGHYGVFHTWIKLVEQFLFANHVWLHQGIHSKMQEVPKTWGNHYKRRNALTR
jgi:hypothetical protein